MEVMHKRVAGLDVHKDTVVACVRVMRGRKVTRECRSFATTTAGLLALLGWLTESRCGHVAMEATGVYWTPVWKILSEGEFELMVANAAHIKHALGLDPRERSWAQDGHERRDVDRRPAGVWSDQGELRSGGGDPGTALADAHPQATGA
jgi:transposase